MLEGVGQYWPILDACLLDIDFPFLPAIFDITWKVNPANVEGCCGNVFEFQMIHDKMLSLFERTRIIFSTTSLWNFFFFEIFFWTTKYQSAWMNIGAREVKFFEHVQTGAPEIICFSLNFHFI